AVFTAFLRDVTERKAAEAALQAAQARLVQQEKLAGLGRLTAGIAHEIKNPLNFVTNFAAVSRELLVELRQALAQHPGVLAVGETAALLDDLDAAAARVAEHGGRADRIVRSMMDHARTGLLERRLVPLNGLVDDHVRLALGEQGAAAAAAVGRDYGADVGDVEVSAGGIGRAVVSLLANALDAVEARAEAARAAGATEAGGPYAPRVTVRTRRAGGRVEVAVADNGPGVAAADLDRIFEPFYTTKPAGQGNVGLGLSLARESVAAHGGTLEVESRPGDGATFTLSFPVSPLLA
ncbi:MAG TPA: ATP-binding protein, partial [Rhodothermales bacterium]|nr:ATP-binding protein [Rhodothermales bacterium]